MRRVSLLWLLVLLWRAEGSCLNFHQDKSVLALREEHSKQGALKLSQFKRIKQLGTGDVGLVDLVELASSGSRSALNPPFSLILR